MGIIDDFFGPIHTWNHRWIVEAAFTIIAFAIIHVGYSALVQRQASQVAKSLAQSQPATPGIQTGPITTTGANSPVTVQQNAGAGTPDKQTK